MSFSPYSLSGVWQESHSSGSGKFFRNTKIIVRERRQSWILDPKPQISDSRYWIPVSVSGVWILNSKHWWYSGFNKQTSPDFGIKKFPDSGIGISVPGATWGKVRLRLRSQSICMYTYRSHLILLYLYRQSLDFECNLELKKKARVQFSKTSKSALAVGCTLWSLKHLQLLIYFKLYEKNHAIN